MKRKTEKPEPEPIDQIGVARGDIKSREVLESEGWKSSGTFISGHQVWTKGNIRLTYFPSTQTVSMVAPRF